MIVVRFKLVTYLGFLSSAQQGVWFVMDWYRSPGYDSSPLWNSTQGVVDTAVAQTRISCPKTDCSRIVAMMLGNTIRDGKEPSVVNGKIFQSPVRKFWICSQWWLPPP